MYTLHKSKGFALLVCFSTLLMPVCSLAEDIDIFTGASAGTAANPNVLFVLDNTSNWSRQSQQWPGGITQGQAEVEAIKTVLNSNVAKNINVGLLEFVTGGNSGDTGGFLRFAIQPTTASNVAAISTTMDTIYNNINGTDEKRSGAPYGDLMRDSYNYFSGGSSVSPSAVLSSKADSNGYITNYTLFKSPLSTTNSCAKTAIVFIGNPSQSGPDPDSAANTTALSGFGGDTTQLRLNTQAESSVSTSTVLGNTLQCYSSSSLASTSDYTTQCANYSNGCSIGNQVTTSSNTCATGTLSYPVIGTQSAIPITGSSNSSTDWTITVGSNPYSNGASVTITGCATSGSKTLNGTHTISSATATSFVVVKASNTPACGTGGSVAASTTTLGYTSQCYSSQSACSTSGNLVSNYPACSSYSGGCACGTSGVNTTSGCASGTYKYEVLGNDTSTILTPTSSTYADTGPRNADEWARFLFRKGVPVGSGSSATTMSVNTFTIDVYNKSPSADHTALLKSMAAAGGGEYCTAKDTQSIVNCLTDILSKIQSINSTFSSASLPVSTTNRSLNVNQVFIGMFRPDSGGGPRWFGNLKQYKLGADGSTPVLQGRDGVSVENSITGFLNDCALSFWTTDSPTVSGVPSTFAWSKPYYWENITGSPPGKCPDTTLVDGAVRNAFSDMPDGSLVEKGAVAEILRKGNNPSASSPTWAVNRTLYTIAPSTTTTSGNLLSFTSNPPQERSSGGTLSNLNSTTLKFMQGYDVNNETGLNLQNTITRSSIHGDVIHSRPLAINYGTGSADAVTVYYGANDGTLRAVSASGSNAGKELWAFIAPESADYLASNYTVAASAVNPLKRLSDNTPLINYPNTSISGIPKNYFFDGAIGVYQHIDSTTPANSKAWIYPTMRRGGRMIYALDVTNSSPASTSTTPATFKWRIGCPNLTNDTGCTTDLVVGDMSGIGQTWSAPNVAFVKNFSTTIPVILVGGGYDTCEDADSANPSCSSTKGNKVYALNADTGAVIKAFTTVRSVVADVSVLDMDNDGSVDYAFAVDTGGNIYRISFTGTSSADWVIKRVAYTRDSGGKYRKFLFTPALLPSQGKVYLALGSGDREHPLSSNYPYSTSVTNRLYVYLDDLVRGDNVNATANEAIDLDSSQMDNFTSPTSCTTASFTTNNKKGWYMDFPNRGEQGVTSALIAGGQVIISTNQPVTGTNTCATSLGKARGYSVNLLNASGGIGANGSCGGDRSVEFVGGGLPPSPVLATVDIPGLGVQTICISCPPPPGDCKGSLCASEVRPPIQQIRKSLYWKNNLDN